MPWWGMSWTADRRVCVCVCVRPRAHLGVFPEGQSGSDNGGQLGHRGRYERPVRQARSSAGSEWPRRGKPQQDIQTVHRLWSCRGNSHTEGHCVVHTTGVETCRHWKYRLTSMHFKSEVFWMGFGVTVSSCKVESINVAEEQPWCIVGGWAKSLCNVNVNRCRYM